MSFWIKFVLVYSGYYKQPALKPKQTNKKTEYLKTTETYFTLLEVEKSQVYLPAFGIWWGATFWFLHAVLSLYLSEVDHGGNSFQSSFMCFGPVTEAFSLISQNPNIKSHQRGSCLDIISLESTNMQIIARLWSPLFYPPRTARNPP